MKRTVLVLAASVLITAGIGSPIVLAHRSHMEDDSVSSGVVQGADAAVGTAATGTSAQSPAQSPMTPTVPAPGPAGGMYAALGDSIAAGAGLPATAGSDPRCVRSTQAYAYQVAQARGLTLAHIACSGATAGDLFTNQGVAGPNISPQLDAAFAGGTPQLITITAGANDMQWLAFLRKCAVSTCGTALDTSISNGLRGVLALKLNIVFSEIQRRSSGTPPTVVITGYSNPISNGCIGQQTIATPDEIAWLNMERDALNQTIRDTAARNASFARYASMDFTGHSLCSTDSWWQGLADPAPLHPNAKGQAAIAASVLQALSTNSTTGTAVSPTVDPTTGGTIASPSSTD